jgi:hypothetical protein
MADTELAQDNGSRTETYDFESEISVREMYSSLMKVAHGYDFDKEDDRVEFEKDNWDNFRFKSEIHGCFLHYWAKFPPSPAPPPGFGKWLLTKLPNMIFQVDQDFKTPIHVAIDNPEEERFLRLLVEGCSSSTLIEVLARKNNLKHNCLHYAILRSHPYTLELIKKCRSAAHLFTATDIHGKTPLHLAMIPTGDKPQVKLFGIQLPVERKKKRGNGEVGNKDLGPPLSFDKPDLKDKENGPRMRHDSNDRYDDNFPAKETLRTNFGLQRRPTTDIASIPARSFPPSTPLSTPAFSPLEVVQELMKYGKEALWTVDTEDEKTPYQYRLQRLSKKNNKAVEEEAVRRAVSGDNVAQAMKEFCLRLPRGDAQKSLYPKGQGVYTATLTESHVDMELIESRETYRVRSFRNSQSVNI